MTGSEKISQFEDESVFGKLFSRYPLRQDFFLALSWFFLIGVLIHLDLASTSWIHYPQSQVFMRAELFLNVGKNLGFTHKQDASCTVELGFQSFGLSLQLFRRMEDFFEHGHWRIRDLVCFLKPEPASFREKMRAYQFHQLTFQVTGSFCFYDAVRPASLSEENIGKESLLPELWKAQNLLWKAGDGRNPFISS